MNIYSLINQDVVDARFLQNDELKMLGWENKPNAIGISVGGVLLIPVVYGEDDNVAIADNIPAQFEFSFNDEVIYPISVGYLQYGSQGPSNGASGATAMP
jgi:hypothetical protein